jgi:hypothetical protein
MVIFHATFPQLDGQRDFAILLSESYPSTLPLGDFLSSETPFYLELLLGLFHDGTIPPELIRSDSFQGRSLVSTLLAVTTSCIKALAFLKFLLESLKGSVDLCTLLAKSLRAKRYLS